MNDYFYSRLYWGTHSKPRRALCTNTASPVLGVVFEWTFSFISDFSIINSEISELTSWQTSASNLLFLDIHNLNCTGKVTTNCLTGTSGITLSTRCMAVSAILLEQQEEQKPFFLQENGTNKSFLQVEQ